MAAYARTPSALTWLRVNHLFNGLHKQISCKNCLYAINSYFTICTGLMSLLTTAQGYQSSRYPAYITMYTKKTFNPPCPCPLQIYIANKLTDNN